MLQLATGMVGTSLASRILLRVKNKQVRPGTSESHLIIQDSIASTLKDHCFESYRVIRVIGLER